MAKEKDRIEKIKENRDCLGPRLPWTSPFTQRRSPATVGPCPSAERLTSPQVDFSGLEANGDAKLPKINLPSTQNLPSRRPRPKRQMLSAPPLHSFAALSPLCQSLSARPRSALLSLIFAHPPRAA